MNEKITELKNKAFELNNKLTLKQKISILAVVLIAAGLIAVIFLLNSKESSAYLFTNLEKDDAAAIVEALKKDKISYQLENEGTAIKVPAKDVLNLRLTLTSQGLPKGGGVGYEIFDNQDITTLTSFTEKVNMVRAIQGELARTISSLAPVKSARVHIVLPKESLFVEDQKEATASVLLNLESGGALDSRQVQSITTLVSSSVEGLQPENVAIVDNFGRVLNETANDENELANKKLTYKKRIEKDYEKNILNIIEPIVGKERARVSVTTDLDFDKAEKTEEMYDPNVTAVRSESKLEETKNGSSNGAGGVAGVQSNLPGRAGQAVNNGSTSGGSLEKSTTNFEINKTVRQVKEDVGRVTRIGASVILDGIATTIEKDGKKETKIVAIEDKQLREIEDLVKTAIGFDDTRGDRVVVNSIPFMPKPETKPEPMYQKMIPYSTKFLPWIIILIVIFAVVRPLIKSIKHVTRPEPITPEGVHIPGGKELAQSGSEGSKGHANDGYLDPDKDEEMLKIEAEIQDTMGVKMSKEHLMAITFARKNIDITTRILKKWLKEGN